MGGNALKSIKTVRLYSSEYRQISMEICNILNLDYINNQLVLCHETKESHGDIDIIVNLSTLPPDIRDYITTTFKPNEIFHNGNCWSFDYKGVQTDFIVCDDEHFESYSMFYNFGLGNFIGRLAHGLSGEIDTDDLF